MVTANRRVTPFCLAPANDTMAWPLAMPPRSVTGKGAATVVGNKQALAGADVDVAAVEESAADHQAVGGVTCLVDLVEGVAAVGGGVQSRVVGNEQMVVIVGVREKGEGGCRRSVGGAGLPL